MLESIIESMSESVSTSKNLLQFKRVAERLVKIIIPRYIHLKV